jgi:hypothetical protein
MSGFPLTLIISFILSFLILSILDFLAAVLHTSISVDNILFTPLVGVLRDNTDVIEFNGRDKADDFRGKKRKEYLVDCVHKEESGGASGLRLDLCDLRNQRQLSEVDLDKLIMSNNNLEMQQTERLTEVPQTYTAVLKVLRYYRHTLRYY